MQARKVFLDWYQSSSQGLGLRGIESAYLQQTVKIAHNQAALQVGSLAPYPTASGSYASAITLCLLPGEASSPPVNHPACVSLAESMPFVSDTFDICLLPHVIEFHDTPQQVLSECERILKPEGQLIILGFNPWHLEGLMHCLPQSSDYQLLNLISYARLVDWLRASRLSPELTAGFSINQPRIRMASTSRLNHMLAQLAPVYAIRAIKRRYNIINPSTAWQGFRSMIATPGLETACRTISGHLGHLNE